MAKEEKLSENLHVLKVQRPLFDSEGNMTKILVYNEDRTIEGETQIGPQAFAEVFRNGEYKVFVRGKMLADGKVYFHEFLRPAEYPEW